MPRVVYTEPDGTRKEIEVPEGTSVMQGALDNGVDGIDANCGGHAMCATCHVYVAGSYLSMLPEMSDDEDDMLDEAAAERRENSRLSCQIEMDEELDGIEVQIPDSQG